ncbi:MAG TPA: right-handed parallel beta-helix repeat-containing protein [Acidimicrobiales bacterium]|jgi:parallel beta-helix repeat protein|nr:right-handed parallel beta-helix repeat-containing protein [Acidimicrobiales bacterium]
MRRHLRSSIVITMALALVAALDLMGAPAALAATVNVGPGQSIQAAINAASPGDTIVVAPGTYRENLVIHTDNITLQGTPGGTVLAPPGAAKAAHNACFVSATNFDGICLAQVSGVTVSGFTVRGFPGIGIHSFNSDHLRIDNNRLNNNGLDGIADYVGSQNLISNNQASGSSEAGILVANSIKGGITVDGNTTTNNGAGIYMRDDARDRNAPFDPNALTENYVINNDSEGNCVGILALDTPAAPDVMAVSIGGAGAGDEQGGGNRVIANNKTCPPTQYLPVTTSGTGILALGTTPNPADAATESVFVIRFNTVRDNVPSDIRLPYAGGIVLGTYPGSPPLTDSNICCNTAFGDQPFDIRYIPGANGRAFRPNTGYRGIGTGVIIVLNNCDTSSPKNAPIFTGSGVVYAPICRPEPAPTGF